MQLSCPVFQGSKEDIMCHETRGFGLSHIEIVATRTLTSKAHPWILNVLKEIFCSITFQRFPGAARQKKHHAEQ